MEIGDIHSVFIEHISLPSYSAQIIAKSLDALINHEFSVIPKANAER